MRNLRIDLCYDGTRYRGWQRLGDREDTIQGKLEQTLSRILEEPVTVSGSGRTDAGVHAAHQVASFTCRNPMPEEELLEALRRYLPEDIGIYSLQEAPERFHARLSAKSKTYVYRIWNSSRPCVFQRRYVWIFPETLNLEQMRRGASHLQGRHDFAPFSTHPGKKSTVRSLTELTVCREGEEVALTFRGDGFLHNMVRILTGTLVEVGTGRREADSIPGLFEARRADTGLLAPAKGLCLQEVDY